MALAGSDSATASNGLAGAVWAFARAAMGSAPAQPIAPATTALSIRFMRTSTLVADRGTPPGHHCGKKSAYARFGVFLPDRSHKEACVATSGPARHHPIARLTRGHS